jgi:hypothetical protein
LDKAVKETSKLIMDSDEILDVFGLKKNRQCAILEEWLCTTSEISPKDQETLEEKRLALLEEVESWNEEELKMRFLAFLFDIAKIDEPQKIKLFYERPLSAVVDGYRISVVCDAMAAKPKGVASPSTPYFFLQEFKKQKGKEQDAEAQMLAAMIVAQFKNTNNKPIFGCYLQGKNWIFTTLHEKNYCVSKQFDASEKEDLYQIIYALRQLKVLIVRQIEEIII